MLVAGYTIGSDRDIDCASTCYAHFFQSSISGNGDMMFCKNSRGNKKFVIGNIHKSSFTEIWNNSDVLKNLETYIKPSNCGLFCKNLSLNNGMEEVINPDSRYDPNFVN